jgi:hypothetical protein
MVGLAIISRNRRARQARRVMLTCGARPTLLPRCSLSFPFHQCEPCQANKACMSSGRQQSFLSQFMSFSEMFGSVEKAASITRPAPLQ